MTTPVIGIRLVLDGKEYKVGLQGATADTQKFGSTAEQSFSRVTRDAQAATVSVGQMNAALRQVPAQFTDIVTSLASGQNPFTVLLQQGGQLKDSFGGVGAAARALGGYVVGLVNPFTIAAAAATGLGAAYLLGQQESESLRRSLILTGGAAGATTGQLQEIAKSVSGIVGTQGAAAEAITALVATGKVQYGQLAAATEVAVRSQRDLGIGVDETAKIFAELAGDPLKASLKLNEATGFLTLSTYRQIKALEEQGKTSDAARLAQDAYATVMKQRLGEIEQGLGTLEKAWKGIKDAAKSGWDAMLNIGRPDTLQDQLRKAQAELAAFGTPGAGLSSERSAEVTARKMLLEATIGALERQIALEGQVSAEQAKQVALKDARIRWDQEGDKYLSKELQMRREIERIQTEGKAAGADPAEIRDRIAAVREKYVDKSAINAQNRELENQKKLLAELAGLSPSFAEDWDRLNKLYAQGKLNTEGLTQAQAALLAKQPAMRDADREAAKALEERERALKAADDAHAQTIRNLITETDRQALANAEIGLTRIELDQLRIKRLEDTLATREQTLAQAELYGASEERLAQIRAEIAATQQLIEAKREGARRTADDEADKEAAKRRKDLMRDAERDADRMRDLVDRSITDGLMRGFENGKGIADNFLDTLSNTFKTTVLRPVVSFVMQPVTNSITSLLGGAPSSGAGGGFLSSLFGGLGSGGGASSSELLSQGYMQQAQAAAARESLMTAGGYIAGAGIGMGVGNSISGGYGSRGVVTLGTAIGAAVAGPVGAAVGGTIAGIANRAFGSKAQETTAVGFEGTFTSSGFGGRQFADWQKKGGWFSRDRSGRDFSALTDGQAKLLNGAVDPSSFLQLASLAGIQGAGDKLGGWSFGVNRAIASDADMAKLIQDVSESLGTTLLPELKAFQADGEALAATATRVGAEFAATNDLLLLMGKTSVSAFNAVGLASTQAREAIIAAAGGLDTFKSATQTYYSKFFSAEEQRAMLAKQLGEQFAALGVAMPETRAQFRALVEGLDLTTEGGQKALGALLALSGSVDQYVTATEAQTTSIANAADQLASSMKTVSGALWQTIADVTGSQSPGSSLDTLMGRFDAAYATALTSSGSGLADAGKTINDLIEPLLSAAKDYYATGADYQRVFQYATGAATQVAQRLDGSGGGATSQMAALVRLLSESQPATLDELAALRAEFAELRRNLERELSR